MRVTFASGAAETAELERFKTNLPMVYVQPGQIFTTSQPTVVKTILGSCVSTCLWDERRRLGGLNHFLIPHGIVEGGSAGRCGNGAMPLLLRELLQIGAVKRDLKAGIFGGASVLASLRSVNKPLGTKNVEAAKDFLLSEGISIIAEHAGGSRGLKLIFRTHDGAALVRPL